MVVFSSSPKKGCGVGSCWRASGKVGRQEYEAEFRLKFGLISKVAHRIYRCLSAWFYLKNRALKCRKAYGFLRQTFFYEVTISAFLHKLTNFGRVPKRGNICGGGLIDSKTPPEKLKRILSYPRFSLRRFLPESSVFSFAEFERINVITSGRQMAVAVEANHDNQPPRELTNSNRISLLLFHSFSFTPWGLLVNMCERNNLKKTQILFCEKNSKRNGYESIEIYWLTF